MGIFHPGFIRWSRLFWSFDWYIYAVDAATGQEKWRFLTSGPVHSSPAIANGVLYSGSHDGNLYAVDIATGQEKWRFATGKKIKSSPAVANGVVFMGSHDRHLYAVRRRERGGDLAVQDRG